MDLLLFQMCTRLIEFYNGFQSKTGIDSIEMLVLISPNSLEYCGRMKPEY